jgi:hypothetical protein
LDHIVYVDAKAQELEMLLAGVMKMVAHFRRLKMRYEHQADIHLAFLQLGCALISLRFLG